MTNDEFNSLSIGTVVYGCHRGSHFSAKVHELNADQSVVLRYSSGSVKWWSKTHIIKYYSLRAFRFPGAAGKRSEPLQRPECRETACNGRKVAFCALSGPSDAP